MRTKARTDANHVAISDALREDGWSIRYLKWPCDLLICKSGRHMLLAEVKTDDKSKLTPSQLDLITDGFPLVVLRTVDDVHRLTALPLRNVPVTP